MAHVASFSLVMKGFGLVIPRHANNVALHWERDEGTCSFPGSSEESFSLFSKFEMRAKSWRVCTLT